MKKDREVHSFCCLSGRSLFRSSVGRENLSVRLVKLQYIFVAL